MHLFWLILLVGVGLMILRGAASFSGSRAADESAEEIVRRRYARGEISREEYERLMRDLRR